MTFFMALVVLVVVATVQTVLRETPGSIRRRQLRPERDATFSSEGDSASNHDNNDKDNNERILYGGRFEDDNEEVQDDGVLGEIAATEDAILQENRQQQEEEARIRQEEEAELKAEEQIKQLQKEKERLLQQLKAEEERREKEQDLRRQLEEEGRQRKLEEEERQKEEELRRLEEEKARLQEKLREEARRLQLEEQEEQSRRQREEEENRRKQEEEARQAAKRQTHKPAVHLERPVVQQEQFQPPATLEQPKIDFCDFMRKKPSLGSLGARKDTGFSNPAVLILGMEDTSTNLLWHVISQILYPGRKTATRNRELAAKATALDFSLLNEVDDDSPKEFWNQVSDKSKGKWMVHVFCQQQTHEIPAGFPWVTVSNQITDNQKAKDTMELIKELPKGSLKIVRIKRNALDVAIRLAQLDQRVPKGEPVELDRKKIFHELRRIESEQKAIDAFLQEANIPHLTLDFDEIFPFNEWTDLVVNAQNFQQSSSHINVDWKLLSTQLEATWRDVLRYIDVFTPLSMYDILRYAMQTHEAHSFWTQNDAVSNFPYIKRTLQGTHYQPLLRKVHPPIQLNQLRGEGDEM